MHARVARQRRYLAAVAAVCAPLQHNKIGYAPGNGRVCCYLCNMLRGGRYTGSPEVFLADVQRIAAHHPLVTAPSYAERGAIHERVLALICEEEEEEEEAACCRPRSGG